MSKTNTFLTTPLCQRQRPTLSCYHCPDFCFILSVDLFKHIVMILLSVVFNDEIIDQTLVWSMPDHPKWNLDSIAVSFSWIRRESLFILSILYHYITIYYIYHWKKWKGRGQCYLMKPMINILRFTNDKRKIIHFYHVSSSSPSGGLVIIVTISNTQIQIQRHKYKYKCMFPARDPAADWPMTSPPPLSSTTQMNAPTLTPAPTRLVIISNTQIQIQRL